jgi:glycosyltransferase involved in cell wall biosynthesis/2-polyprenyl-3-methyl-5-hydroxy-6-metoxy-1,4-benzoquinol methylase
LAEKGAENFGFYQMKKAIIFSDTYLPLVGGAELYTYNFANQLRTAGFGVTIFTNAPGHDESEAGGVFVIRRKWPGWRDFSGIMKLASEVSRLIKENDVVFSNYSYRLSTLVSLIAALCRKPIFIFAHGLGTIIDKKHPFIHKVYRYLSLKLAKGAIATSSELADICRKYNRNVIVATAVDFSFIDRNLNAEEVSRIRDEYRNRKIILTARRLVPKNGIQYLIKTLSFLPDLDFVCLIAGVGRLENYLKNLAKECGVRDKIKFLGEIENKNLFNYMKAADVIIFPSSAEAMSLAAIEAMYIGTPLVATRVGGLIELVGKKEERGFLTDLFGRASSLYSAPEVAEIPEEKYRSFAEKIVCALHSKNSFGDKTVEARRFVSKTFGWEAAAKKIIDFTGLEKDRDAGLKDFYSRYADKIIEKRFKSGHGLRKYAHIQQYLSILNFVEPGIKVLDAGCGEGIPAVMMAQKGAAVTACDLSGPNIKRAREYAKEEGVADKINFLIADSENLPFADNSFDLVVSSHVLEHLPDFDRGLAELMRVTRKRAIIAIPTILNLCSLIQVGGGDFWMKRKKSFLAIVLGPLKMLWALLTFKEGVDEKYAGQDVPHVFRFPWVMKRKVGELGYKLVGQEASSICLPLFEFLLPVTRFLDKYKSRPILRNFGYGTTYVIDKS